MERILPVRKATPENFAPYGHVVGAREPGSRGPEDDALDLSGGRPRFYIMRLERPGRRFHTIARHCRVTQCLASVGGQPWLLGVAPPQTLEDPEATPDPDDIAAFEIPGDAFVLLNRGTWHAGPYFDDDQWRDFFNLELADTNRMDLHGVDLQEINDLTFRFGGRA